MFVNIFEKLGILILLCLVSFSSLNISIQAAPDTSVSITIQNRTNRQIGAIVCSGGKLTNSDPTSPSTYNVSQISAGSDTRIGYGLSDADTLQTQELRIFDFRLPDLEFLLLNNPQATRFDALKFCNLSNVNKIKFKAYPVQEYNSKIITINSLEQNPDFAINATVNPRTYQTQSEAPSRKINYGNIESYPSNQKFCLDGMITEGSVEKPVGIYTYKSLIKYPNVLPTFELDNCGNANPNPTETITLRENKNITIQAEPNYSKPMYEYNIQSTGQNFDSMANGKSYVKLSLNDYTYGFRTPPVLCINGIRTVETVSGGGRFLLPVGQSKISIPSMFDNSCTDEFGYYTIPDAPLNNMFTLSGFAVIGSAKYPVKSYTKTEYNLIPGGDYLIMTTPSYDLFNPVFTYCLNNQLININKELSSGNESLYPILPGEYNISFPTKNGTSCENSTGKFSFQARKGYSYNYLFNFETLETVISQQSTQPTFPAIKDPYTCGKSITGEVTEMNQVKNVTIELSQNGKIINSINPILDSNGKYSFNPLDKGVKEGYYNVGYYLTAKDGTNSPKGNYNADIKPLNKCQNSILNTTVRTGGIQSSFYTIFALANLLTCLYLSFKKIDA